MNPIQLAFFNRMESYYATSIENGLKLLLETKHLYQSVRVEPPDGNIAQKEMKDLVSGASQFQGIEDPIEYFGISLSKIGWEIKNPGRRGYLPMVPQSEVVYASIEFVPSTVKLFCHICKRNEAYNFQHGIDLLKEFEEAKGLSDLENKQVFSLAYQCQSCKSTPEIFVVQRENLKLVQSGRTPIEEIEMPSFLPKKQKKYFSDAVVAFNSGQTLAGNFLLRTFVEQYVRSLSSTPDSQDIDFLFSEYGKKLPDDFKQRFPSLQSIYDKLSNDLHIANASEDVFAQSRTDLMKHFQARELYEL